MPADPFSAHQAAQAAAARLARQLPARAHRIADEPPEKVEARRGVELEQLRSLFRFRRVPLAR